MALCSKHLACLRQGLLGALSLGLLLVGLAPQTFGQSQSYRVSGQVVDAESQEGLIGASVYVPAAQKGAVTDAQGHFSFQLSADTATLKISYAGYQTAQRQLQLPLAEPLKIRLKPTVLEEVVVESKRSDPSKAGASTERLDIKTMQQMAMPLGETDIMKAMQLRPGIASGGEGSSGLHIRGGRASQNLYLYEGMPLYNPNHLFGFFSLFHGAAVRSAEVFKAGFPAEYGDRSAGVVDVGMKKGGKEFGGSASIGLISSSAAVDGPFDGGNGRYLFTARRTYFDILTRRLNEANKGNENYNPVPNYYFQDLNLRTDYQLSPDDRLTLSAFISGDNFHIPEEEGNFRSNWSNKAAALHYDRSWSPEWLMENTFSFSDYRFRSRTQLPTFSFSLGTGISEWSFRQHHLVTPQGSDHTLSAGFNYSHYIYRLANAQGTSELTGLDFGSARRLSGDRYALYFGDLYQPDSLWQLRAGLRLSLFAQRETFLHPMPRFSAERELGQGFSAKVSASRMVQFNHLASNSGATLPSDIWFPSRRGLKPQISDQVAAGWSWESADGSWQLRHNFYFKNLQNQVDFRDDAQTLQPTVEDDFVFGKGHAYGTELMLEKQHGRWHGWLSYTLSWAWNQFEEINQGRPFNPRQDRRHDLALVGLYEINPRWKVSANWVLQSGSWTTVPTGRFLTQDLPGTNDLPPGFGFIPIYEERNNLRLRTYHRLDLGLIWKPRPESRSTFRFSLYNAYNRRNAYILLFLPDRVEEGPDQGRVNAIEGQEISLFPILPAISYKVEF